MNSMNRGKQQNNKNPRRNKNSGSSISTAYLSALRGLWEGRPRTTIERLSEILAHDPNDKESYHLYRLWIDVLADQMEHNALKSLDHHLSFRCEIDDEEVSSTFMALRGLIQFELDNQDGANLILRAVKHDKQNPYVLELLQLCENRVALKPKQPALKRVADELVDYFHLKSLAQGLLENKNSIVLMKVLHRIKEIYPESPLPDEFKLHQYTEQGQHQPAIEVARNLARRYPGNFEFGFQLGYVLAQSGDFDQALSELSRVHAIHNEPDIDFLNCIGYCLAEKAIHERSQHYREEAIRALEMAAHMSRQMGVPAVYPMKQIKKLENFFNPQAEGKKQASKAWIIKLTAKNFHQIRTTRLSNIKNIQKPLGDQPSIDDICFLVGEEALTTNSKETRWRLAAIYKVSSDPIWHPLHIVESLLTLIERPELAIPLDVRIMDEGKGNKSKKNPNQLCKSIFELDSDALDVIEKNIAEYADSETNLNQLLQNVKKIK